VCLRVNNDKKQNSVTCGNFQTEKRTMGRSTSNVGTSKYEPISVNLHSKLKSYAYNNKLLSEGETSLIFNNLLPRYYSDRIVYLIAEYEHIIIIPSTTCIIASISKWA